jgi:hypothetical protein
MARIGALSQIVFAGLIGGMTALVGTQEPDFVPRPVLLFAIFALPGVVGLVAIARHRPATMLAAGIASAIGSLIAFSLVTLIFLIPAGLMLIGAATIRADPGGWGARALGAGRGVLVLALLLGAGGAGLLITDERCWAWRETPGGIVMEPAPYTTGEMTVPTGSTGFGCSSGTISARGVGLGFVVGLAAIGIAGMPRRRPVEAA